VSVVGDWMYMWASGPIAEVTEDPMHLADMAIIGAAGWSGMDPETAAAIERVKARGVWSYEEGGRRYQSALLEWRYRRG